jgi:Zn-dependent protease
VVTVTLNIALVIFNLVPIPPLDGSKILYSILPPHVVAEYRQTFETYSLIIFVIFIVFFSQVLAGPTLALVRLLLGL